ncbi:hypothetical protein HYPSUDRAFT_41097 [Hypholoma sublateritium FD-334 SS-4]|uniref:Carbohydrate-binding module family 13 protein n=1 Tax=Hypholoma sublateritium (strain FD-334 SS-4) TaxID=945553 RepID=A0A0D2P172_HYPSF|nr:hypothetical protein HYPSUDRAFT_41097 [Hypholoma sublateritium FD-334 SS-4]
MASGQILSPGIYQIVNVGDPRYTLDLSGYDKSSILAYGAHGGKNQKWYLQRLGAGYSICSVYNGAYMTWTRSDVDNTLVANEYPTSWAIEAAGSGRDVYTIRWSDSLQEIGISEKATVRLSHDQASKGNQYYQWKFTGVPMGDAFESVEKSKESHSDPISIPATAALEVQIADPTSSATTNTVVGVRRLGLDGAGDLAITTTTTTVTTSVSIVTGLGGLQVK